MHELPHPTPTTFENVQIPVCQTPSKLDLELIKQQLFSDSGIHQKILQDYGFRVQPQNADAMAAELITQLEQSPVEDPRAQDPSNADAFRAAVTALGSNSRAWATFLKVEPDGGPSAGLRG